MVRRTQGLAVLVIAVALLGACKKKEDGTASDSGPKPGSTTSPAKLPAGPEVAFMGTYKKIAEDTIKDGKHVHLTNTDGTSTITIDRGVVTWQQDFPAQGVQQHVTQIYTFDASDVTTASNGFQVKMAWKSMNTNDTHYNADKLNPKIVARKIATGWNISLSTTDTNGVIGGVEFK